MIDLVFGVHLYQPPNQKLRILREIIRESYLPLIKAVLSHDKALFAADIARSAIEELEEMDSGQEFLKKLEEALEIGKVYLVNTGGYHPIFPLIPEEEVIRQIRLNEATLFHRFHQKPTGVFPPEMALNAEVIKVLGKAGYLWTVTDDVPFSCCYGSVPFNWIPKQKQSEIAVFLRSNFWSNRIAFNSVNGREFVEILEKDLTSWFENQNGYLIIWMDWETFGHHKKGFIESFINPFFDKIAESKKVHLVSPDYLLEKYPRKETNIPSGSWSTSASDFRSENYWPLWKDPNNEFHKLWWKLADLILKIKGEIKDEETLTVFDKALYSCQTWQFSMGNKLLAVEGMEYFRNIASLKEAESIKNQILEIIDKLEKLCQQG